MLRTIAFLFALALGAQAHATTITFNNIAPYAGGGCGIAPATYSEAGYTVAGCPSPFLGSGVVHLDDAGTSFGNSITVTYGTGQAFTAHSVDVWGYGSNLIDFNGIGYAYDNVLFQGYSGANLVATQNFSTGLNGGNFTVTLSALFQNITSFVITQVYPSQSLMASLPGQGYCPAPCAHVDIDNIVVSAVPLPASAAMLAAGLLGLVGFRSARRRPA